jgi:hypothetical protein
MHLKEVMGHAGDKVVAQSQELARVQIKNKEIFVYGLEAVSALSIILKN